MVIIGFSSKAVFESRADFCSSCSGSATGLVCSSCSGGLRSERDALFKAQLSELLLGFAVVDPDGIVGVFPTIKEAEAFRLDLYGDDPDVLEEIGIAETGFVGPLKARIATLEAENARLIDSMEGFIRTPAPIGAHEDTWTTAQGCVRRWISDAALATESAREGNSTGANEIRRDAE